MTYEDDLVEAAEFALEGEYTKEQFLAASVRAWDTMTRNIELNREEEAELRRLDNL